MNIVKKDSFRSQGNYVNKTDDMYRVVIDMTRREFAHFSQWKAAQKELEEVKPSASPNTTKFAIQELVEVLKYFVNNAPMEEQAWMKERLKIVLEQSNVC